MTSWLRNKRAGRRKSAHQQVSAPKVRVTQDQDDDVKRQINSDPHNQRPIYRLVDVKSGAGQLIELIKARARQESSQSSEFSYTNSSTLRNSQENQLASSALDEQIRALVEPLLYNQGRGKLVSLARLWRLRLTGSGGGGGEEVGDCETGSEDASSYRRVCWRLEERGFVGETALHICFLLATPSHMILAQKLLRLFPSLINDIYTCDEYFGESSLHMAIVNENVKIVKLLLDHGANVHERCLGNFFLPDDQKPGANAERRRRFQRDTSASASGSAKHQPKGYDDNWTSNELIRQTNYSGYTYWGEYALSFAASLGLADCYQLLLAKGADPNRRDSNGNSTLHLCVIANRLDMFDLCYSNGAQLDANLNNLNLSPLTLAAKLRRVEMFQHILTLTRKLNWILCNHVAFLDFPLQGIDSINSLDGSRDDQSLLAIVVGGNSNEHLQMLDGLLSDLLQVKWETSLRNKFYSWLAVYILMLVVSSIAYVTRFKTNDQAIILTQYASEMLLLTYVICYLFILIKRCLLETTMTTSNQVAPGELQVNSDTSGALTQLLSQAAELIIHTFTCLLILVCLPLRLLDWRQAEDFLVAIVVFLLPMKLLFFCRGSKSLGSFIVMIYRILVNDVLCFVVFLVIFISGFAQSFLIIFQTYRPTEAFAKPSATYAANTTLDGNSEKQHLTSLFESIVKGESLFLNLFDALITMHMMALNEFSWVVDEFTSTDYPQLAKCLFCAYMILVSILLINMLIAMLGKTYQDISSQPNENLRQWARALLTVERVCSPSSRLAMLDRYSHVIRTSGLRCYSSTWALGQQDLESINVMKQLKQDHQLNSQRLLARTIKLIKH